jgi:hypothetical protein
MKKAKVTNKESKLFNWNASLKNAINTELTHVINPNTKKSIPIIIKGPLVDLEVVVIKF